LKCYAGKAGVGKSLLPNAGNAGGYGYAGKGGATLKSVSPIYDKRFEDAKTGRQNDFLDLYRKNEYPLTPVETWFP